MKTRVLSVALCTLLLWGIVFGARFVYAAIAHNTGSLQQDSNNAYVQSPCGFSLIDNTATAATILNIARSTTVVTVNTAAAHGFVVGQQVVIAQDSADGDYATTSTLDGTYVIATTATSSRFTYTHGTTGTISQATIGGTATAYMLSPMPTDTTAIALKFPAKAVHLTVLPTAAGDVVVAKTSGGATNGKFILLQGVGTGINGVEGDVVYIIRTTTTPIYFAFDTLR